MTFDLSLHRGTVYRNVADALAEDVGSGDITAQLIAAETDCDASIITREECVVCGIPWADETFRQLDSKVHIDWQVRDGARIEAGATLARLNGPARALLTGERVALNFLQTLSGTATLARRYADTLNSQNIRILDTRKTLPGLRIAQKYAVATGGCHNHRVGLYDAFLIKENHIAACGGISAAIQKARSIAPGKPVEVETETVAELKEAIHAGADIAMLDNFSSSMLEEAMGLDRKDTKFELSGNLSLENLHTIRNLKIDYCSFGALTKHVRAVDLSMRVK